MSVLRAVTMRTALEDNRLLGSILGGPSWLAWRVILIAAMGEALRDDERAIFKRLTGREREAAQRCEELWAIVGRRGGKSLAIAVLVIYLAILVDYSAVRSVGERLVVLALAPTREQAQIVFGYIVGIVESTPVFASQVVSKTSDSLSLKNGIEIETRAASFRGLRGFSSVAVVADEGAFFYSDESGSSNSDSAILEALRPSLATTGGPLCVISSPYARKGALYDAWARDFGADGDPLIVVAQGDSRSFNPSLPQKVIDRAMARDAASASAEYGAQWRNDMEACFTKELVDGATDRNLHVRPPRPGIAYRIFVDVASGTGGDGFSVAVADRGADGEAILDLCHEVLPPFSASAATAQICAIIKSYGCTSCVGDKYGAGLSIDLFAQNGIRLEYSERDRSAVYLDCLPLMTSGKARLLDIKKLAAQLVSLERRTSTAGRDSVNHPQGQHDDLANAACGALVLVAGELDVGTLWAKAFGDWATPGDEPTPPVAPVKDVVGLRLHMQSGEQRKWNFSKQKWQFEVDAELAGNASAPAAGAVEQRFDPAAGVMRAWNSAQGGWADETGPDAAAPIEAPIAEIVDDFLEPPAAPPPPVHHNISMILDPTVGYQRRRNHSLGRWQDDVERELDPASAPKVAPRFSPPKWPGFGPVT
jgi:hypothetical protein